MTGVNVDTWVQAGSIVAVAVVGGITAAVRRRTVRLEELVEAGRRDALEGISDVARVASGLDIKVDRVTEGLARLDGAMDVHLRGHTGAQERPEAPSPPWRPRWR